VLSNPRGLAIDAKGIIYIGDFDNGVIDKMTPDGKITFLAGGGSNTSNMDGKGAAATFNGPAGLAVDKDGNVFVADGDNNMVRKISPAGQVTTLAGSASASAAVQLQGPMGVAVDAKGNVYVAETHGNTVRKISSDGTMTTFVGKTGAENTGSMDGKGAAARFGQPRAIAVDSAGVVYIADEQYGTVRKIATDGTVSTLAGDASGATTSSKDGVGTKAGITSPRGIAVDAKDNVYVADTDNGAIRKITPDGTVTTFAGKIGEAGFVDGKGAAARFAGPRGIAVDKDGNIYVADSDNGAIRKITPDGTVTTLGKTAPAPESVAPPISKP